MNYCDTYFIGYDAREHEAACVAAYSIRRRVTRNSRIYILDHQTLRRLGYFWRKWTVGENGQFYDVGDERPFSTGFSHSRFLVFHLARELKCKGPCMFVDCDWLFLDDPGEIMAEQETAEHEHLIGVVSRKRVVQEGSEKMDGMAQHNYARKLWSALFTFVPSDALATVFSPKEVNEVSGRELHAFRTIEDYRFWDIDPAWHYIPSLDPKMHSGMKGIHFSEFSPWLNPDHYGESPGPFEAWMAEREAWLRHVSRIGRLEEWDDLSTAITAAKA